MRSGPARAELAPVLEAAQAAGVRVEEVSAADLAAGLGEGVNHQGVALAAGPLPLLELAGLCAAGSAPRTLVALDQVEDPQNLGAIARVADAAGVSGLLLTDRHSPPLSPAVARASAGAIEWLATARVPNLVRALNQLKSQGFWIFGAEVDAPDSLFELPERVVRGERVVVLGRRGPRAAAGRAGGRGPPGPDPARRSGRLAQRRQRGGRGPLRARPPLASRGRGRPRPRGAGLRQAPDLAVRCCGVSGGL